MSERVVSVVIRGRVQGVGYRAWTRHQAELHGLRGWVRNRRDGAVEALFAGPAAEVAAMLKACEQGPQGSAVTGVEVADASEQPEGGFRVLPTP